MDLALFFDALDEFDGHLDMISRFMKSLLTNSRNSGTRVKVCLSSRPWEPLEAQFSSYPGLALQDYTKHDIEEYALGSLVTPLAGSEAIVRLVPVIIERANGVFFWVRFAIKVLLEAAAEFLPPETLEQKLQGLTSDLFEFYELIVERISKPNRRRTFALLELLIRHKGPPADAYQIRDAVLISECATFDEAVQTLGTEASPGRYAWERDVRNGIDTWSGGLVEIKVQNSVARLQLIHQTILEFAMGLWFKRMVVGDLATILQENGHSFHF